MLKAAREKKEITLQRTTHETSLLLALDALLSTLDA